MINKSQIFFFSLNSTDQFEAMTDELERRREECLQLRALLAEKSISTHSIAKQSYGGIDDLVNEDNELTMAYKSQRDIIRYVLTVTHPSCREENIHTLNCQTVVRWY